MGFKWSTHVRYASGIIVSGYIMGVIYIQAWMIIWYISDISGKRTARLDSIRPTPRAKAVRNSKGMGRKKTAHVIGLFVMSRIRSKGTKDKIRLTSPVPTDDTENTV